MLRPDPESMTPEAAKIEAELAEDRARLAASMDKLRAALAPDALLAQGAGLALRGGGKALGVVGRAAWANPGPAALIGAGLAWLILGSRKPAPAVAAEPPPVPPNAAFEDLTRWESEGGPPGPLPEPPKPPRDTWAGLIAQHPFLAGAVAAVAGAALARALPRTRTETEVMGPARAAMMAEAADMLAEEKGRIDAFLNEGR